MVGRRRSRSALSTIRRWRRRRFRSTRKASSRSSTGCDACRHGGMATHVGDQGRPLMATATPKLALRPYLPEDTPLLAEIFRDSILELTGDDYTEAQQEAWIERADDLDA